MATEIRKDLKIAGSTTVAGGTFHRVTIAGQAEINGDLDCVDFNVSGSSEVKGNLKAGTFKVSTVTSKLKLKKICYSGLRFASGKCNVISG